MHANYPFISDPAIPQLYISWHLGEFPPQSLPDHPPDTAAVPHFPISSGGD